MHIETNTTLDKYVYCIGSLPWTYLDAYFMDMYM